jgi:cytochrome c-type biogenesis protein CcmH
MNFWIFAIALLAIPAIVISWPLFTGSNREKMLGVWVLVLMPLAGLLLYQQIGTPKAINIPTVKPQQQATIQQATEQQPHDAQQPEMDEMIANLQQRMEQNPDDPDGWIILGRTLKTLKRYAEAETALSNAYRLVPDNALVMVELAEARLFASGQAELGDDIQQLLEAALAIDPQQQKGLWLLGMGAAQDGQYAQAIEIWQRLLGLLDPASGAAQTVTQQIDMASAKLGQAVASPAVASPAEVKPVKAGSGIPISLNMAPELAHGLPPSAVLYIFIHPSGGAGMPLAVKRIGSPAFPVSLTLSDADLLRPGTSLNDHEKLDVSARVSMTGIANATSGDYQANRVTVDAKAVTEIALNLDQGVP